MKTPSSSSNKRLDKLEPLNTLPAGSALVIVAHPDDETIWMGGTIRANPHIRWTIFSLCRASDPDREPKFRKGCAHYGARSVMTDVEDLGVMSIRSSVPVFAREIRAEIGREKFSYLFSHAANGEYGHPRHRGVFRAVRELVRSGELRADKWYTFAYRAPRGRVENDFRHTAAYTRLKRPELSEKRGVIQRLYGFSSRSFENVSCLPLETFAKQVIGKRGQVIGYRG